VLQEREFEPLGAERTQRVDVRVIAATNRDLDSAVSDRTFREDLYYRISVIPVLVPPLRTRAEDIPALAHHFLKKYCPPAGKRIVRIAPESLESLREYEWPGNVRQLENAIERAVALENSDELHVEVPKEKSKARAAAAGVSAGNGANTAVPAEGIDMESYVAGIEKDLLKSALSQANGVQTKAAEMLRISYRSFRHLMKKYEL
jgi:two-component system response regulator PilR (NtrC family)